MKSEVFNMDCMEGMKQYPNGYFDLAIVDPPYGINAANMSMGSNPKRNGRDARGELQYGNISVAQKLKKGRLNSGGGKLKNRLLNTAKIDWDNEPPTPAYFLELKRVSKQQIIWGGNYFHLPPTRGIVVWDKRQPWENFSQVELAWTSFDCPAKLYSQSNKGGANNETKIHPTQKPVKLYTYLLQHFAKPGYKILDTHVGSGSSRIAAHQMGYDFTGYEIDTEYFLAQEKRFKLITSQQTLNFKP